MHAKVVAFPAAKIAAAAILAAAMTALGNTASGETVPAAPVNPAVAVGDYAGWAYMTGGGDFPVRLHVTKSADGLAATIDFPAERAYGLVARSVRMEDGALVIERTRRNGKWQRLTLSAAAPCRGRLVSEGDDPIELEFTRADEPLPTVATDRCAACVGLYSDGRRSVMIESWFWGELNYTEYPGGVSGTLFARTPRSFLVGPAEYVPSPVRATLEFAGPAERPDRLEWTGADGGRVSLPRVAQKQETVSFRNGDVRLVGKLVLPPTPPPHRALVVLGGSGSTTRDTVGRDATLFALMGFAVLTFDLRGAGESTGESVCSFEDTASDAQAAVAYLRSRDDIRRDCVGLSGRSRGGWFAPLAAADNPDVAFLVLHVAPAVSPAAQENTRRLNAIRKAGHSDAEVAEAERYLALLWKAPQSDEDWNRYVAERDRTAERPWRPIAGGLFEKDSPDYRWQKLNMTYDPIPALERVRCPVLALFGEQDDNVTPADNLKPMESALRRGGNRDLTMRIVPGTDHSLRILEADGSPRRIHRAVGYVPGMWQGIEAWLEKRFKR